MDNPIAPEPAPNKKLKRKQHAKWPVVLAIFTGITLVLAWFAHSLSQPAEGIVVSTIEPAAQTERPPLTIQGKTATFKYPATVQVLTPDVLAAGDVEKFLFGQSDQKAWRLAIQVKKLPTGVLSDDGGYNLRLQNPERYEETKSVINGQDVSTMIDKDGTNGKVAFITHGGLVAEVASSGSTSGNVVLDHAFTLVLQTWQWQ